MTEIYDEPTLVRSLISVTAHCTNTSAPSDMNVFFHAGLIKLRHEGMSVPFTGAELANLPFPYLDQDSDWIWQFQRCFFLPVNDRVILTGAPESGWEDVRTKRKFENGSGLAFVMGYETNGNANPDCVVTLRARFLLLNN